MYHIVNVAVVDPRDGSITAHQDIRIADGRIAGISATGGPQQDLPAVDGRDRFVVPGFVDMRRPDGDAGRDRQPVEHAFALFLASYIHECRGEWAMTQRRAEAAINISRELELANWPTWSSIMLGRALAEQGHTSEGVALILESLDALRSMGSEISRPHFLALLAESLSKEGRAEEALAALDEALVASNNSDERYYEAELHRLRGDLKLMQFAQLEPLRSANDVAARAETDESLMVEAEASFRQAILIARQQGAKSLELRAVISLSRMLRQQGKLTEAREMLAEVHGWFTEGFDTADLKAAKMLLDEMGAGAVLSNPGTFAAMKADS